MSDRHPAQYDFCTLGMFIIDDIHPPPGSDQKPQLNVIGGAGTYSAIGARLFSPPPVSRSVGWVVDAGTDFPEDLTSIITSWDTGVVIRPRDGPTTRGWNGYSGNQHRAFKYLTEKKRLTADDLTGGLAKSKSYHLICSPLRAIAQVKGVLSEAAHMSESKPMFIWEPVPNLCIPEELQNTLDALQYVDVISPNHEELAALFGFTHPERPDKAIVEEHAQRLFAAGIGPQKQGAVVVRVGAEGCFVLTPNDKKWLPAFHTDPSRVVDPTGGGNGFLGGLAVGLVRTNFDVVEAARWGSVAASFTIEQVGMPVLTPGPDGAAEKWNGVNVQERLAEYRQRCP